MRASSASSGACRSPRENVAVAGAQRLPPIVAWPRTSRSPTWAANVASGSGAPSTSAETGVSGADAARPAGALDSVEPGATEVERPLRTQAAELDVGHDDRAARNDSHPGSVTERSGGVICRGGDEDVGEIRQFAPSRGLGSTRAILTL